MRHSRAFRSIYLLPLLCFGFYSGILLFGKLRTAPNKFNYFKQLSLSFLEGKLDIPCPKQTHCHDLALTNGKYYFYFAPVPAFAYLPAVLIWNTETPDSLIAAAIGAANVFLFIILFYRIRGYVVPIGSRRQTVRNALRSAASREDWYFALLWGLGSVHFYMSMQGDVWHLAQTLAQTFLLAAASLILSRNRLVQISAGIFFALACYTRNDILLGVFFFLSVIWINTESKTAFAKKVIIFLIPFAIFSVLYLLYNYARFGNVFELGVSYMKLETQSGLAERAARHGLISAANIPGNFYREILATPEFMKKFPFIHMNPHGFGILWATPVYLLVVPLLRSLYNSWDNVIGLGATQLVALGSLVSAAAMSILIFMLPSDGYMQFSARYTLDFQLFLILFLVLHPGYFRAPTLWVLLAISIYMNFTGAIVFTPFFQRVAGVP